MTADFKIFCHFNLSLTRTVSLMIPESSLASTHLYLWPHLRPLFLPNPVLIPLWSSIPSLQLDLFLNTNSHTLILTLPYDTMTPDSSSWCFKPGYPVCHERVTPLPWALIIHLSKLWEDNFLCPLQFVSSILMYPCSIGCATLHSEFTLRFWPPQMWGVEQIWRPLFGSLEPV